MGSALALVAPAGFTQADRELWLKAAVATLKDLPADLIQRGVEKARLTVDHPSKIIPAIMAEVGDSWRIRQYLAKPLVRHYPARPLCIVNEQPLTLTEIRACPSHVQRLALAKGWIGEDEIAPDDTQAAA